MMQDENSYIQEENKEPAVSYKERSLRRRKKKMRLTKLRLLFVLIMAAWIFVAVQAMAGALFEKNSNIVTAFSVVKPGEQQGILEITARYTGAYPDAYDKKQMLYSVAESIGLNVTEEPVLIETEARSEVTYEKKAAAADTTLRIISLTKESESGRKTEHYVYAKIHLKHSIQAVSSYKKLLKEALEEMKCTDISATIQLIGTYEGYLTVDRRNKVTDEILEAMGGEIAYEHREDDLYTVYAYTALLDDYITVEGKKINLHIAMSKDEANYRTIVYLASPILPDTW
ncbi:MAG: YwmB family TATA-box binding protein [Lachnospiraceae bacterium]